MRRPARVGGARSPTTPHCAARPAFPGASYDEQRAAAEIAVAQSITVLTGGPGTGKTTTVAGLLALLAEQASGTGDRRLRIALAAPTGKAAARLQEAVQSGSAISRGRRRAARRPAGGDPAPAARQPLRLGGRASATTADNRLPHDVIVVDETSMVSLTMMARLLEAVRPRPG